MDQKLELLKRVPLFSGCDRKNIEVIGGITEEVDVAPGTVLMRQGDTGDAFYVIVSGSVSLERDGAAFRTLGPGDFLGELALLDHGRRSATATAAEPTRLIVLGHREFEQMMTDYEGIRGQVWASVGSRLRNHEPSAAD